MVSLAQQFDEKAVRSGVSKLRNQLLLHGEYYVGSGDAFVNRETENKSFQPQFFSKLDAQRERLGYFRPVANSSTTKLE
jgi:hypothetical protein